MNYNHSTQEDDWMVVIQDSIFYNLWTRCGDYYLTSFNGKESFQ
jgi:hypothetical protein